MAEGATCENYAFRVETISPYRVVDQGCQDFIIDPEEPLEPKPIWSEMNITNATQQASCVTKGTDQFGTTTTTTSEPPTTTTTTSNTSTVSGAIPTELVIGGVVAGIAIIALIVVFSKRR